MQRTNLYNFLFQGPYLVLCDMWLQQTLTPSGKAGAALLCGLIKVLSKVAGEDLVGTVGAVEVVSARGISKDLVVASYTNTPGIYIFKKIIISNGWILYTKLH